MASIQRIVHLVSTGLLVLLFGFAGFAKLTTILGQDIHNEMKTKFATYVGVYPISMLGLDPDLYRILVGGTELICIGLLVSGMARLSLLANEVLLVIMIGAIYTHYGIGEGVADMGGAIVGLALVLIRLFTFGPFQATKLKV